MARFSKVNQTVKCRGCNKLTTVKVCGVVGMDLCAVCQKTATLENEHFDGLHKNGPVASCPLCKA
jgi:hypothetical protein